MSGTWIEADRQELAAARILDAAGELFATSGVASVGMAQVAEAAGCSRATLYRYFPNRDALRMAFVQRAARHLGAEVARETQPIADPAERLEAAVLRAVDAVRGDPLLAAWFDPASVGIATDLAAASEVIESLTQAFLGDSGAGETDAARWTVRIVVSLLSMPGRDRQEERRLVREVLVPAVLR